LAGSNIVVPGKSVGGIYLREPASQATVPLGQPSDGDTAMGRSWGVWVSRNSHPPKQYALDVLTIRDDTGLHEFVEEVRVTSPWFITRQGVSVGSSFATVLKAFPCAQLTDPDTNPKLHQTVALYDDVKHGILFEFEVGKRKCSPSTKCTAILIHPKGRNALDEYMPWYMKDDKGILRISHFCPR